MSSTAVFAGVAASQAAIAQQAAHEAKVERCMVEVSGFNPSASSITEKQSYADCISTLYPQDLSHGAEQMLKIVIVILLVSVVIGLWRGYKTDGLGYSILMGLVYPAAAAFGMLCFVLIGTGIAFVFGA